MILLKNYFVNTTTGVDVLSVIHEVNRTLKEANAVEGLVCILVPEPGAALSVLEPLPDIVAEFKKAVQIFPGEGVETKNRRKEEIDIGPRIVAAMLGKSLQIPIKAGKLVLGSREEPILIDLEKHGRRREFYVQVIGEGGEQPGQGQQQQGRPGPARR